MSVCPPRSIHEPAAEGRRGTNSRGRSTRWITERTKLHIATDQDRAHTASGSDWSKKYRSWIFCCTKMGPSGTSIPKSRSVQCAIANTALPLRIDGKLVRSPQSPPWISSCCTSSNRVQLPRPQPQRPSELPQSLGHRQRPHHLN